MLFQQAEFIERNTLPDFLNQKGLTGEGVEVGTHRGEYAAKILKNWQGRRLYCVDPWCIPPGYEPQVKYLGAGSRDDHYSEAKDRLKKYSNRVLMLREMSVAASEDFEDETLDFVYLDGDHAAEGIRSDLAAWWPKVKPGGILAGHDIICPGESDGGWGAEIQPVVMEFARRHDLTIYLIIETLCLPWSYYLQKEPDHEQG